MKRSKYDIMATILDYAIGGIKKTPLVYKSNLNFQLMNKYTKTLIEIGFLTFDKKHFITTEKGKMYLKYLTFSKTMYMLPNNKMLHAQRGYCSQFCLRARVSIWRARS